MSVTLASKLTSIPNSHLILEMNTMLDKASVTIAWSGKRLVKVEGYSGGVEISALVRKYLQAPLFDRDASASAPLVEVMVCYELWGRIRNLYRDSDKALNNTLLYKYLIPSIESRPSFDIGARNLRAISRDINYECWRIDIIIEFTPREFMELWPNKRPQITSVEPKFERCFASKKMIEDIVRNVLL